MSLLLSFESPQVLRDHLGMQHCSAARFVLFLGFPAHLFNVCAFRQAQPLVRLLLHAGLFSPALCLLLLLFSCSCSFFITDPFLGTAFYPLLLEVVLKKTLSFPVFSLLPQRNKEIKVCATFEGKNMKRLCLKMMLNTMSLICMCGKKRSEQTTCVTFNLCRVSRITLILQGMFFPQGIFEGHS